MGLFVSDKAKPDAPYWAGRRTLGAIDALAWPLVALWALWPVPGAVGLIKPMLAAICVWLALGRLYRAVWVNHRYRFLTWTLARAGAFVLLVALVLKLSNG